MYNSITAVLLTNIEKNGLLVIFNFPKTLTVLLLCLTLVGQSMANTAMSYHMMSMSGMKMQSHSNAVMDHSNHNMANSSVVDAEESSEDCCVKSCNCFTGGCSNVAALMKSAGNYAVFSSAKIFTSSRLIPSQKPSSLYRPPILS